MALTDQVNLAANVNFQNRVQQSMIAAAIAISNEALTTGYHNLRAKLAKAIINTPASYAPLFTKAVVTDATVQADAGTVTGANSDTQQALVTDAHINNAVSSVFNSFFAYND